MLKRRKRQLNARTMAFSNADLIATDVITLVVSILFSAVKLKQLHLTHPPRKASAILGAIALVASTILIVVLVALSRVDGVRANQAQGKLFLVEGEYLPYPSTAEAHRNHFSQTVLQVLDLWVIRSSYLSIFWGLTEGLTQTLRRMLIICTTYVSVASAVSFLIPMLYCRPFVTNWRKDGDHQYCNNFQLSPLTAMFAMSLSSDLVLLGFGICLLRSLNMRSKAFALGLSVVFAVGIMALLATVLRYVYVIFAVTKLQAAGPSSPVAIQVDNDLTFWQKMELLFGTAAYGLTTMRYFVRYVFVHGKDLFIGYSGTIRGSTSMRLESMTKYDERTTEDAREEGPRTVRAMEEGVF